MMRFKRRPFRGKYQYTEPVWHVMAAHFEQRMLDDQPDPRFLAAICGFKYDNIFMDAKISKAVKSKPAGPHCKDCDAKLKEVQSDQVPATQG